MQKYFFVFPTNNTSQQVTRLGSELKVQGRTLESVSDLFSYYVIDQVPSRLFKIKKLDLLKNGIHIMKTAVGNT